MGPGKNVNNHVRENVGRILFKRLNCYIFVDIRYCPLNVNLEIQYNVQCGLSYGLDLFRCKVTLIKLSLD